ncbi:MAG: BatA domain-containing protein [bacterium]
MIGFGLPALLPLALLAALPVLIHILSRARLRRIEFPTLRLLENMERERVAWTKLREVLLLVLRTAALLTLLLALARPYARPRAAAPVRPDLILLIDDSYSMRHGSTWQRARALIDGVIRDCPPDGRVVIRLASSPESRSVAMSRDAAAHLADTLQPSCSAARASDGLAAACRTAESLDARLAVVTDLQRRSLTDDFTVCRGHPVTILDAGVDSPSNLAISSLTLESPIALRGRNAMVRVEVANFGRQPATAVVELEIESGSGTTEPGRVVSVPAQQARNVSFETRFDRPGPVVVRASLQAAADSLELDNTRLLAIDVRDSLNVLVVWSGRVAPGNVAAALTADPAGRIRVADASREQLGRQELRGYDAIIVTDALALQTGDWSRLLFALDRGTGLVLMASPLPAATTALAGFARVTGIIAPSGFVAVGDIDSLHPVLSGIDPALWRVPRFRATSRVEPESARVLARLTDGNPLLLEAAGGRVLIWTTGPVADFGDLVRRAVFVPLLVSSVEHVAIGGRVAQATVGDTLRFPVGSSGSVVLEGPGGRAALEPRPRAGQMVFEFAEANAPGSYRLNLPESGRTLALAAVNVVPDEGDLDRMNPDELSRHGVTVRREAAGVRDLVQLLLMVAAAAFAAELLLLLIPDASGRAGRR